MKDNKMHYDLDNVHYVPAKIDVDGTIMYDKPVRLPGAMSLELSPEGDISKTRADGIDYLVVASNNGYTGTLNFVSITDQFRRDCLGEMIDSVNGIQYEDANVEPTPFALMFEFKGDKKNKRHILYNNIATRIAYTGENKDNQKEPDTDELEITTSPAVFIINGEKKAIVKGSTTIDTQEDIYLDWFNRVYIPGVNCKADVSLKTLSIDALKLDPVFSKDVHDYAVTATADSNTITATATDANATVEIKVNGTVLASGGTATWSTGSNEVTVKVTNDGFSAIYTISVTKGVAK